MQEEQIPESKQFLNEKKDKDHEITMQLIAETSLKGQDRGQQQHIQQLIRLKTIHLEWLNIRIICNLEVFTDLTILYLQHVNKIRKIQGLDSLINLEYLALNNNLISSVQNLAHLNKLSGLILSNNQIEQFESKQLPETLTVLSMKDNPVCLDVDYKQNILKRLKLLEVLDDQNITPTDKFKILGLLPSKVATYNSQMKQFYTKRQIQHKFEQNSKPVLFNTELINEKEALSQIRQTTRKYKYQNAESFKKDQAEQNDFFQEKLAVSKKIRGIKQEQENKRARRLDQIKTSTMQKLMLQHQ